MYIDDNRSFIICEPFIETTRHLKITSSSLNRYTSSKSNWRKMNFLNNTIVSFWYLLFAARKKGVGSDKLVCNLM